MNIFASNDEKARGALQAAVSHHAMASAELAAHRLAPADAGDFAGLRKHAEKDDLLARDAAIAAEVLKHWTEVVGRLDAEAAEREIDAEHAVEEKKVAAEAKRLPEEYRAWAARGVELLSQMQASRARTDAINAKRGDRPFIVDTEFRVRQRPGEFIKAITQTDSVWVNADGEVVSSHTADGMGKSIPNPDAVRQEERVFFLRQEQQLPPTMPNRLTDEIRLVDLEGRQIWPST